jgi:hypothetical protein
LLLFLQPNQPPLPLQNHRCIHLLLHLLLYILLTSPRSSFNIYSK